MKLTLEFTRADSAGEPFAFRMGQETYLLRSEGGLSRPFTLAWDEALLADLARLRDPSAGAALRQKLGELLRAALLPAGLGALEQPLAEALARDEAVHITVRSGAAELYALPWELMALGESGRALVEIAELSLSYAWPETTTTPIAPNPPAEGGRVVLAASAAGGAVPLDAHAMAISRACAAASTPFDPAADVLQGASLPGLAKLLAEARARSAPIRVLQLLAHGQGKSGGFGVALDDGLADAAALRGILAEYADMVRCVVLSVCDAGSVGTPGAWLSSVAQTLHRAGIATVLASRAPLSVAGSVCLSEGFFSALLVDSRSVREAVREARLEAMRAGFAADSLAIQLHARDEDLECRPVVFRPYRGLLPFSRKNARFYVGREAELRELNERVQRAIRGEGPRLLVLSGPSACGKTSLIFGGLLPILEKGPASWDIRALRMDAARADELEVQAIRPTLLVVDQIEEAPQGAGQVLRALWALSQRPGSPVVVLLPLRVDLLETLGSLALAPAGPRFDAVAWDQRHSLFLTQMSEAALVEIIREPARRVGLRVDDGLVAAILSEVGDTPAPLPVLAVALDALWARRVNDALDPAAWRQMGGFSGALARTAEAAWAALAPGEQPVARKLLLRMVHPGETGLPATRRRLDLDALDPDPARDRVLDRLIEARICSSGDSSDARDAGRWAELAHDALLRAWPRLRDWVEEERGKLYEIERLNREFETFQEHRSTGAARSYRLTGGRLARARELCERFADELPAELRAWVDDCARRERRQAQRGRVAALVVAILATLAAINMTRLAQRAGEERSVANASLYARELLSARALLAAGRDREAVGAALHAHQMAESGQISTADTENLAGLLSEVLHGVTLQRVVQGHPRAVLALVASPDGRRVASAGLDGSVALWSADGRPLATLASAGAPVTALAFAADGQAVLIGTARGGVCRWSPGQPSCALREVSDREIPGLAEGQDGRLIIGTLDGRVISLTPDGTEAELLGPGEGLLNGLALAPDGALATAEDFAVRLLSPGGEPSTLPLPGERALAVQFRPGRPTQLAIATAALRLWTRGQPPAPPITAHIGGLRALAFLPDGRSLLTLGRDEALVWHRMVQAPGRRIVSLRANETALVALAEGRVVTGSESGILRFRATSPTFVRVIEGHRGPLTGVAWTGPETLATSGADGRLNTVRELSSKLDEGAEIVALARQDDDTLIALRADGQVQRWSLSTGLAATLCQTTAPPTALALLPDGRAAWAGQYGVVGLCQEGEAVELLPPDPSRNATALAAAGGALWAAMDDGSLERLSPGGAATRVRKDTAKITALLPLADGVLSGSADGRLIWPDGAELPLDGGAILALDAREDGLIAAACADGSVRLVRPGAALSMRALHDGPIRAVAFSADGQTLATGGDDWMLRLSPVALDKTATWVERACAWLGEGC